jgi:DNA-binding LacI/PurR family transcriptional regulator
MKRGNTYGSGAVPVTIHDVAKRAQVSPSTVSRALSASHLVRGTTRDRVLAAARELGYRPNPAAQSLITGRTGNIGIVVPDLSNPFYTGVLRGVQARARQAGYAVFFADSEEDAVAEEALVHAMARQVDGVIVCAPFASDAQLRRLADVTSLTLLNRRVRGVPAALMDSAGGTGVARTSTARTTRGRTANAGAACAAPRPAITSRSRSSARSNRSSRAGSRPPISRSRVA